MHDDMAVAAQSFDNFQPDAIRSQSFREGSKPLRRLSLYLFTRNRITLLRCGWGSTWEEEPMTLVD
jgi:hypothetical protein